MQGNCILLQLPCCRLASTKQSSRHLCAVCKVEELDGIRSSVPILQYHRGIFIPCARLRVGVRLKDEIIPYSRVIKIRQGLALSQYTMSLPPTPLSLVVAARTMFTWWVSPSLPPSQTFGPISGSTRAGPYRRRRIGIASLHRLSDGRFPHRRGGADLVVAGAWPIFMSGK